MAEFAGKYVLRHEDGFRETPNSHESAPWEFGATRFYLMVETHSGLVGLAGNAGGELNPTKQVERAQNIARFLTCSPARLVDVRFPYIGPYLTGKSAIKSIEVRGKPAATNIKFIDQALDKSQDKFNCKFGLDFDSMIRLLREELRPKSYTEF